MRIDNHITYIDPADPRQADLALIHYKVRNAKDRYLQSCILNFHSVDLERENGFRDAEIKLNETLNEINRQYKTDILKVNENYKKVGLWIHSYAGVELIDLIGKDFNFDFHRSIYTIRTKVKFSADKYMTALRYATALLFAKYETVYSFQFEATAIKILCDYFECELSDYKDINRILNTFVITEYSAISDTIKSLDFKKPKKKVSSIHNLKGRKELPTKEMFEEWINSGRYSMKEIKETIAEQFKVSPLTVHRRMDAYGLIRKYSKR